jgi:hypothetical protein
MRPRRRKRRLTLIAAMHNDRDDHAGRASSESCHMIHVKDAAVQSHMLAHLENVGSR